jgi:hypothetical protein
LRRIVSSPMPCTPNTAPASVDRTPPLGGLHTGTDEIGRDLRPRGQEPHLPAHDPLKVGTLAAILGDVATHLNLKIDRDELLRRLFD